MTAQHGSIVSAKISKKLKQELKRSGIDMPEVIRRGLQNALKEKKIERLELLLQEVDLSRLADKQIIHDIRSGRKRKSSHN